MVAINQWVNVKLVQRKKLTGVTYYELTIGRECFYGVNAYPCQFRDVHIYTSDIRHPPAHCAIQNMCVVSVKRKISILF